MKFLQSIPGEYMAQTFLYSLVVAGVVEILLRWWHLSAPEVRLKFRLLILVLPGAYWAMYQLSHFLGAGESFRQRSALFELSRWLNLEISGDFLVGHLLLFLMGLTTSLFLFQEVLPPIRRRFLPREPLQQIKQGQLPKLDAVLTELARHVPHPLPPLFLTERSEPVICIAGTFRPVLVLSTSLIDKLDQEELKGVLAHEIAHLRKGDNWKSWILLMLRTLMFYNPVALVVFRRLAQENEKICDDLAVRATGEPLALASGVIKVFRGGEATSPLSSGLRGWLLSWGETLDHRTRSLAIEERVARLLHPLAREARGGAKIRLVLVAAALFVLLFFVV